MRGNPVNSLLKRVSNSLKPCMLLMNKFLSMQLILVPRQFIRLLNDSIKSNINAGSYIFENRHTPGYVVILFDWRNNYDRVFRNNRIRSDPTNEQLCFILEEQSCIHKLDLIIMKTG